MSFTVPKTGFPREPAGFPAIIRSSLWNSEEISALTKTDRQAVRIADYLHVYRDSETPQTKVGRPRKTDPAVYRGQGTLSRGSARTNGNLGVSPPPSARPLLSQRNVSQTERQVEKAKAALDKLTHTVQKAQSDKLELQRDLATYDHLLCEQSSVKTNISSLRSLAASFLDKNPNTTEFLTWEQIALEDIAAGFQRIEAIGMSADPEPSEKSYEKEDFDLRELNNISHYRQLYRGVAVISNRHAVVTVKSNGLFRQLLISAVTLNGAVYRLTLKQDMMEQESLITKRQIHNAVKTDILPHLYFQMAGMDARLLFDPSCGVSFVSLIIAVKSKEARINLSAELVEDKSTVNLTTLLGEVTIPKKELTSKSSIFQSNHHQLATKLQKGLYLVDKELVWHPNTNLNLLFHMKETTSLFFNDEYISERLQTVVFMLQFAEKYVLDSETFRIEFLSHKNTVQLRIVGAECVAEITSGSAELQFLLGLQAFDCKAARTTFLRSLELRSLVKQVASSR